MEQCKWSIVIEFNNSMHQWYFPCEMRGFVWTIEQIWIQIFLKLTSILEFVRQGSDCPHPAAEVISIQSEMHTNDLLALNTNKWSNERKHSSESRVGQNKLLQL